MLVGPKKNPVEILTPEDIAKLPQQEQHKWEIAAELGLFDKIIEQGWEECWLQLRERKSS